MKLSKDFYLAEYACRCGCGWEKRPEVLAELKKTALMDQKIRDHFNRPTHITSGARCPKYNRKVGGARSSQHVLGTASDKVVEGVHPTEVAFFAETLPEVGGLHAYLTKGFCHSDRRPRVNGHVVKWEG